MKVWRVVAEEAPYFFRYPARAGFLIQAPFPLSTLEPVHRRRRCRGPFWRDRKFPFGHGPQVMTAGWRRS
jgi:hypothetical protein